MSWVAKFPRKIARALAEFPNVTSNPMIMSGQPCVAGRRIPVWVLAGRYAAGEDASFLAKDYDITERDVDDAIRFALRVGDIGSISFWKFYKEIETFA